MKPTQQLHELGQSIWLDNITRTMLDDGTLKRYIAELSVSGLTSNPTIFAKAIMAGHAYDDQLADLRRAAGMFAPVNARTDGVDGWVSLEVSPLLTDDSAATIEQVSSLHSRADCNIFIKIPGTEAGRVAIEDSIFAGIPINVTLLFSTEHYRGAVEAYMRGLERRLEAGLDPAVPSVASLFVSRWDKAVTGKVPEELRGRLGIAVATHTYRAYRELLDSERWQRLQNEGARPQRLLWASTGTKDPEASDVRYVEALGAPFTINTMPEQTLLAFSEHGQVPDPLPVDGGDTDEVLAEHRAAGLDLDRLAAGLQRDGAEAFDASWAELIASISSKGEALAASS